MLRSIVVALAVTATGAFSPGSSPIVVSRRAAVVLKTEAAARARWLAKLDQPTFGAHSVVDAQPEVATAEEVEPKVVTVSEAAAKSAWLSKLDQPKLGVKSEAAAKADWLAKIDQQMNLKSGKVVPTEVAPVAEPVPVASSKDIEAAAKAAWLAKLDQ